MLKVFMKFPVKFREFLLYIINFLKTKDNPIKIYNQFKILEENDKYDNWGNYNINKKIWKKSYRRLSYQTQEGLSEAKYFFSDQIEIIKQSEIKDGAILICLVKNDIIRIKEFINHYRNIGIENIVIIDNNSDDGTFEYLKEINEINLFQIKEKYSTIRRQSWINRIISFYGFDKWYLIVDSDEFIVYNDMENHAINDLICYYELNNVKRCRALMIDMYPKTYIFNGEKNNDFKKIFKYFDTDTYIEKENKYFQNIVGGMRKRVFNDEKEKIEPFLVKYPLIFFEKGDIQYNSHYSSPFYKNFNSVINIGILHYKFLSSDLKKIEEAVKNKNFANGSKEYKSYLKFYKNNPSMSPIYDKTKEYKEANDIYEIDKLKKIKW